MSGGNHRDLRMSPEAMRQLAARATDALVERIDGLSGERPWNGEFREVLEGQLGPPFT